MQEAMQIWETIAVSKYNEYIASEQALKRTQRR
nr:MAG TPA: hypothetical protein [Caudoviricetes sp.]